MLSNLFKKKPTFTPAMQELFVKISLALPHRFHFLQKQLTEGIIKGIKKPEGRALPTAFGYFLCSTSMKTKKDGISSD